MANIWDEFDKAFDTEALAKDVEEVAKSGGQYKEVPFDTYEVAITKLEFGKSKSSGNPMLIGWMKILEGEYKGSLIFMYQPLHTALGVHKACTFLRALVAETTEPIDVQFKTFSQFKDVIMNVHEAIDNNYEYSVKYSEDSKGFKQFEIKEVYVLED